MGFNYGERLYIAQYFTQFGENCQFQDNPQILCQQGKAEGPLSHGSGYFWGTFCFIGFNFWLELLSSTRFTLEWLFELFDQTQFGLKWPPELFGETQFGLKWLHWLFSETWFSARWLPKLFNDIGSSSNGLSKLVICQAWFSEIWFYAKQSGKLFCASWFLENQPRPHEKQASIGLRACICQNGFLIEVQTMLRFVGFALLHFTYWREATDSK